MAKSAQPAKPAKKRTNVKAAVDKAVAPVRKQAAKARAALKTEQARRIYDHAETVGGGIVGGAMHGAGIDIEAGDMSIPIALPLGVAAAVAGVMLKQRDIGCAGVGLVTYGSGRLVEDVVEGTMKG